MGVIHPDITKAETLPSNYYRDEIIHHKLMQKFASSWNFIGLESTLNEGDVVIAEGVSKVRDKAKVKIVTP